MERPGPYPLTQSRAATADSASERMAVHPSGRSNQPAERPTHRRRPPRARIVPIVALVAAMLALTLTAPPAVAQGAPEIVNTEIGNNFPTNVQFSALVGNGDQLGEAVLFYRIPPEGAITRLPADISRGEITRLSARVPTSGLRTYVPAGSDIEWYWELTATNGAVTESNGGTYRYEDPRYEWQPITQGAVTLYYYSNEGVARSLLEVAAESVVQMTALLDVEVDFPINIYLWASPADATGVERVESETFDQQTITGGSRVLANLLHVFTPTTWVVRHELTHVITKVAGEGGVGSLPSWLDEGTATYGEGNWRSAGSTRGPALDAAVRGDRLLSVRGMASTPTVVENVELFYGQSAGLVTFLIEEFGEAQFAELFRVFNRGSTVDGALEELYGFNRDGLEDVFRASVGLAPRLRGEDASTRIEDESAPVLGGGESPEAESAESVEAVEGPTASRNEAAIAERTAEIQRRQATRRVTAPFAVAGKFPWDEVVTGAGGGALALALVVMMIVLRQVRTAGAAPASPGVAASSPEGGEADAAGQRWVRPSAEAAREGEESGDPRDPGD